MLVTTMISISAEQIAEELLCNEHFTMDVLALIADEKTAATLAEGHNGSEFHCKVAPFLRQLADALERKQREKP